MATRAIVIAGVVMFAIGIVHIVQSGEFPWYMALWLAAIILIVVMRVLQLRAHRRTGVYRKRWGRLF